MKKLYIAHAYFSRKTDDSRGAIHSSVHEMVFAESEAEAFASVALKAKNAMERIGWELKLFGADQIDSSVILEAAAAIEAHRPPPLEVIEKGDKDGNA